MATPPMTNHLVPVPPTNIMVKPMVTMRMVPDRWGSSTISPQMTASTAIKGSTP